MTTIINKHKNAITDFRKLKYQFILLVSTDKNELKLSQTVLTKSTITTHIDKKKETLCDKKATKIVKVLQKNEQWLS